MGFADSEPRFVARHLGEDRGGSDRDVFELSAILGEQIGEARTHLHRVRSLAYGDVDEINLPRLVIAAAIGKLQIDRHLGFVWHAATLPKDAGPVVSAQDAEYAKLMGKTAGAARTTGFPTLAQMAETAWKHVSNPFYDNGPNDKGLGIQLLHSLGRVSLGFLIAAAVAIPVGFVIGMSPLFYRALNPFIQVLKPISPLAWIRAIVGMRATVGQTSRMRVPSGLTGFVSMSLTFVFLAFPSVMRQHGPDGFRILSHEYHNELRKHAKVWPREV